MSALNITKNNFQEEVMNSDKPVLLDFWAGWCGPCRMLSPVVDEIAEENDDIKVCKINVDEQQDLASEFKIMTIPTLMVFKNGEMQSRSMGVKPKEEILEMLQSEKQVTERKTGNSVKRQVSENGVPCFV